MCALVEREGACEVVKQLMAVRDCYRSFMQPLN